MLQDPDLLFEVLSSMRKAVPCYLSAKMRAGVKDTELVLANAKVIEAAGADFLVVHPRRGVDHYKGVADWRIVKEIKNTVGIPVVGNGDCWYAVDALRLEEETGCDGIMLGRPALRNPWIFRQIAELRAGQEAFNPSANDVLSFLERSAEQFKLMFPDDPYRPAGRFKELIRYVGRSWADGRPFVREILRIPDLDSMLEFAKERLKDIPQEQWDLDATGRLGLELRPMGK